MRILWITNVSVPTISESLGISVSYGGGWLVGLSEDLLNQSGIELCIVFPLEYEGEMKSGKVGDYHYYAIPCNKFSTVYSNALEKKFRKIYELFKPDVIHIWGTEYTHTLHAVNAAEKSGMIKRTVISIQGLVSVYAEHYFANILPRHYNKFTLKELIKIKNLKSDQRQFIERGKFEIEALKKVHNVIGRTDWDRGCTFLINPKVNYYLCNESLRNSFYSNKWDINTCEKLSIFVSQSQYPIKGFHMVLEAVKIVKKLYPDVHIYVTGKNRLTKKLKEKLSFSTYDKYINKLISKYELSENVTFLGTLNEEDMCKQYLKANVFVSASSIENSPNSVGEAMLLGVPTISSDVGGVKNLIRHNEDGYIYPFSEPYMLAYYLCKIFEDESLALKFSELSRKNATLNYSRAKNLANLMEIYSTLK